MAEILFIGIFFLSFIVLSIVMFFINKKDMWLQGFWILCFLVHLGFLLFLTDTITNIQDGYPLDFDRVMSPGASYSSTSYSQELVSTSNFNHVTSFDTDDLKESSYRDVDFCFKYNNSDGANVIRIAYAGGFISDYVYLKNNTLLATYCIHVNVSYVREGSFLGVNCLDCAPGNKLGILLDKSGVNATAVKVDATNPKSYTLEFHKPYLYWLEVRTPPFDTLNSFWFIYIWVAGGLILIIGVYFIVKIIAENQKP